MADVKVAPASAVTENYVRITSLYAGDCIPLNAFVQISYSNANLEGGGVGLGCGGAMAPPDQPVAKGTSGSLTFKLGHGRVASGHTVTASLKDWGVVVSSDSVGSISIGNPCSVSITVQDRIDSGFYTLDASRPLDGVFDPTKGNEVVLLVEQPSAAEGQCVQPPQLVFADPAVVNADAGTWTHPVIKSARKGMLLRAVLTKDGEVISTVRAKFV
jgi:hypothetical protein